MLLWKKKRRPFIKDTCFLKKKAEGSAGIYIIALMVILFFCFLLLLTYYRKRMYITYDTVDDSIVSALTSACTFNLEAYGYGGQVVIFDVPIEVEPEEPPLPGEEPAPELTPAEKRQLAYEEAVDRLTDTNLLLPAGDQYLTKSYSDFMKALKRNLKLDDTMQSSLSGIEGEVIVEEFSIYNRFEEFYEEDGSLLAYRIIKYTYSGGAWTVYPYNLNTPVMIYNSYDKADSYVEDTSVTAKLTFNVRIGNYNSRYMPGLTEADMVQPVFYQRLVDIKKN